MEVICERCKIEGVRFEKGFKMSKLFHVWLCDNCLDLGEEIFLEMKEKFLNRSSE